MSIKTIAYSANVIDNQVVIQNSEGDSIVSDNTKELLGFLAKNYGDDSVLNRKVFWNLDVGIAPILKTLGLKLCRELVKEPDCEALWEFTTDGIKLHNLSEKTKGDMPEGHFSMYYHRGTSMGLQIHGWRKSYFYHLKQFFETEQEIDDPKDILVKAKELVDAFFSMGLNPLRMSSPVSVYESNVLQHLDLPTLVDLPRSLSEKDCDQIADWAEDIMYEWTTALAVGHWLKGETFDYDLTSAYGAELSNLYNFKYATFWKSDKPIKEADWGIMKGKITIYPNVKCSPICYNRDGQIINPVGCSWHDIITLPEARFLYRHKIGEFELAEGYFWKYTAPVQPFKIPMQRIFSQRQKGGLVNKLAKRILASVWSKAIQRKTMNGEINKYYSPILALQVKTNCRLSVANFIYNNSLQDVTIHIGTDGVRTTRKVTVPQKVELGAWKENPQDACVIISPGRIHTPTHNPQGLFYQDIIDLIEANPKESYFAKTKTRRMTLGEAIESDDLNSVGELQDFSTSLDLVAASMTQDLDFKQFPKTGRDLLEKKYYGEPISL